MKGARQEGTEDKEPAEKTEKQEDEESVVLEGQVTKTGQGVLIAFSHFQGTVIVFIPLFGTIGNMFCHLLCIDIRLLAL